MTEKRFELTMNGNEVAQYEIIDHNQENLTVYNNLGNVYFSSAMKICELLNELHEENMMLKEYNNKLMKQPLLFDVQTIPNTMKIIEANPQLEEENEQLKHRIKKLQNELNNCEEDYILEEYL